jgi:hypothetical protein
MKLNSTGKNPCGPLAGIRDRDRRPCEGSSQASATQPVVSARTASRGLFLVRDAEVRSSRSIFLPDIYCAMPAQRPSAVTHAYAMIFCSSRHGVKLIYTAQMAWRSTPMGIDRSNHFCRTILFFLALLVTARPASSATLEDAARELARKVAAALPSRDDITVEIQNISTLTPKEIDRVSHAFFGVLQDSGFNLLHGGAIHVGITLSENVKGFLWSAEISQGDASRVFLTAVPRNSEDRPVSSSMPILLRGEKFWEGPEQILDAMEVTTSKDGDTLLLLETDGLIIRRKGTNSSFKVEIPVVNTAHPATRRPLGSIQNENACLRLEFSPCVVVNLNELLCTIALETRTARECHIEGPADVHDFLPLRSTLQSFPRGRSEITEMSGRCGMQVRFSAGIGDYTQPDLVQAFEEHWDTFDPVSDELSFPGPVMSLHVTDRIPTAIVRNLQTGNYEAYRISITCAGQ